MAQRTCKVQLSGYSQLDKRGTRKTERERERSRRTQGEIGQIQKYPIASRLLSNLQQQLSLSCQQAIDMYVGRSNDTE